jgi:hypothetical protein
MTSTGASGDAACARNELIRVKTGDAFDVVGERVRTDFQGQNRQDYAE